MKKVKITIMVILGLGLTSAQASVIIGWANNTDDITRSIDVVNNTGSDVGFKNSTAGNVADWQNESTVTDTWTAGSAGDLFHWTLSTAINWTDAAALNGTTMSNFLANVTPATEIDNAVNAAGVNSSGTALGATDPYENRINLYGEALIMTIDSTSLSAGTTLQLSGLGLQAFAGYSYSFAFYDQSAGTVTSVLDSSDDSLLSGLNLDMDVGDQFVVAAGLSEGGNGLRLDSMSVDMIPEPATLGLIATFGAAMLFIRRRFVI